MSDAPVTPIPGHSEALTHVCETCGLVVGDDSLHTHGTPSPDDDGLAGVRELLR